MLVLRRWLLAPLLISPLLATEAGAQKRTFCVHGLGADARLNVRSGPGLGHSVVGRLGPKTCDITLAGRCTRDGWCEMTHGGTKGWVETRFIGVYEWPSGQEGNGVTAGAFVAPPDTQGRVPQTSPVPVDRGGDPAKPGTTTGPAPGIAAAPSAPPPADLRDPNASPDVEPAQTLPQPVAPSGRAQSEQRAPRVASAPAVQRAPVARRVKATPPLARKPAPPVEVEQGSTGDDSCVARVERWDTLRIRTGPGVDNNEIGAIPHDACGVEIVGNCRGRWCPVTWKGRRGWVNTYFLD